MATAEHGFADRHEIGDGVVAIADELGRVRSRPSMGLNGFVGVFETSDCKDLTYLVEHRGDQGLVRGVSAGDIPRDLRTYHCFCMVQTHTTCETTLCQEPKVGNCELVKLPGCQFCVMEDVLD